MQPEDNCLVIDFGISVDVEYYSQQITQPHSCSEEPIFNSQQDLKKLTNEDYEDQLGRSNPTSNLIFEDQNQIDNVDNQQPIGQRIVNLSISSNVCAQVLGTDLEKQENGTEQKEQQSNKQKIKRDAKKNALQFFAGLIYNFFQNKVQELSEKEIQLLQKLKKSPTISVFNEVFKLGGGFRKRLCQFLEKKYLWKQILSSKVRNYTYKLVYKDLANTLRRNFIKGEFKRLSSSTN